MNTLKLSVLTPSVLRIWYPFFLLQKGDMMIEKDKREQDSKEKA